MSVYSNAINKPPLFLRLLEESEVARIQRIFKHPFGNILLKETDYPLSRRNTIGGVL
jgi:hypothetical protein